MRFEASYFVKIWVVGCKSYKIDHMIQEIE